MKEQYERLTVAITQFDEEDVITTSAVEVDRNNAYFNIDKFKEPIRLPGPWH